MSDTPLRRTVDAILENFICSLMALMVLNVLWQVFTRYFLRSPSPYTEELARFLLIWLSLFGASLAAGKKLHLAIDFFTASLQGRRQLWSDLLIQTAILAFAGLVLLYGGTRLTYIVLALGQTSAALQIKLGYVYAAAPLSGLLIIYYCGGNAWRTILQLREDPPRSTPTAGSDEHGHR